MKVLFLTSWYPTPTQPHYGVFVKEHAKAIHRQRGVSLTVVAFVIQKSKKHWHKTITDTYDEEGIRTILIEIQTRWKDVLYHLPMWQYRLFDKAFTPQYGTLHFDIVHSNVVLPAGYIGHRWAKKQHIPHIITEHWSKVTSWKKNTLFHLLAQRVYGHATAILPVSDFLKKKIAQQFTLAPSVSHIIPNIVDTKTFTFKAKKSNPQTIRLITIANWSFQNTPTKLPELLIEAIKMLQQDYHKRIEITFVGDGNKLPMLQKLCSTKNIQATFVGYATKPTINQLLHASDFLVHCSTIETFGLTIVEALLTGTPVICSSVGALPEKIDNTNGVLVANTLTDWVAGLQKGFETTYHHQAIAQTVAKKYDYDAIGNAIVSQYHNVVAL